MLFDLNFMFNFFFLIIYIVENCFIGCFKFIEIFNCVSLFYFVRLLLEKC